MNDLQDLFKMADLAKNESEKKEKTSYLSKHGYVLKKDELSCEEIMQLKRDLVGRPIQDEKYSTFTKKDNTFLLYTETKNKIYIPKMYGLSKFGKVKETKSYMGIDIPGDNNSLIFNGKLYPDQIIATDLLLNELKEKNGGILSLQTGGGKTFCALYVLSKLKKKTIIVVNKITLMKQWEQEIQKFLPAAKIGFIQGQKNIDIHDKDIVIAMLQSLARIEYPMSLFEDIGVTILDEVHNTSSKVFSKVLMKLCSKYTIGLSATPKRSDGCEYVFKWFLGDIVYESKTIRNGLPPIINTIKLDTTEYKEVTVENKMTGGKQIQYSSMVNELVSMPKRNKLIVEKVKYLVLNEKRRILILSDRREHLKYLKKMFDDDIKCLDFTYGLFLGQMKMQDLEKSKKSDVILATYSAFGEGVSEKDLDTLILITPKKFIGHLKKETISKSESGKLEQIVGRIFRKDHIDTHPLIIDLQDNFSIYKNQSSQRMVFYKQHFSNLIFQKEHFKLDEYNLSDINDTLFIKKDKKKYKLLIQEEHEEDLQNDIKQHEYNTCLLD